MTRPPTTSHSKPRRACWIAALCCAVMFVLLPGSVRAGFLNPGDFVIHGPRDSLFTICNRSSKKLYIAFVYANFRVRPVTYVPKGWYEWSRGECTVVAINGLDGVMAVMYEDAAGEMKPFYSGVTSLDDVRIGSNDAKTFKAIDLCIGTAPFSGYRENFERWICPEGKKGTPFNVRFRQSGSSYTLDLK